MYGIIFLAAGSSSRLGQPKQLLPYKDTTLLQHLINEAKNSSAKTIVVVLGANEEMIQPLMNVDNITVVINKEWTEGMASSIRCGIQQLQEIQPGADAAVLLMCDQPFVTTALLNDLITTHEKTGKPVVTSYYDNTTGPPALFHRGIFPELLQLTGDKGARKIVETYSANMASISFPEGNIDIDTAGDYSRLIR